MSRAKMVHDKLVDEAFEYFAINSRCFADIPAMNTVQARRISEIFTEFFRKRIEQERRAAQSKTPEGYDA